MNRNPLRTALAAVLLLAAPALADPPDSGATRVSILEARDDGRIEVEAVGHGVNQVKLTIRNASPRRLKVVLPPGLVGASTIGQGMQSMGLSPPTAQAGAFGAFRAPGGTVTAFRCVPPAAATDGEIDVAPGEVKRVLVPSVCLNYGLPTPTPQHRFALMDVADYSPDPRVHKALRTLASFGTSQPVAQAVMWNVCNGLTLRELAAQTVYPFNVHELTLAARLLEAVDATGEGEIVDGEALRRSRVLVRVRGEGSAEAAAGRLREEIDGLSALGLPIAAVRGPRAPSGRGSGLFLDVALTDGPDGQARAKVTAKAATVVGWSKLGMLDLTFEEPAETLGALRLADALEREVIRSAIAVEAVGQEAGETRLRLENRLPLTVAGLVFRTGEGSWALDGIGLGPGRSTLVAIPADEASLERVELNGL